MRYIQERERKGETEYLVILNKKDLPTRTLCVVDTLEAAVARRNEFLGYNPDLAPDGVGSVFVEPQINSAWSPEELWQRAYKVQDQIERTPANHWYAVQVADPKPIAVAFVSDAHMGSPYTDYRALVADTNIIASTEGMYAVAMGDERDNWIVPKLAHIQRRQEMTFDAEVELYKDWLKTIEPKLLVQITGNHELWAHTISGLDLTKMLLPKRVLYDKYEVKWVLQLMSGDSVSAEWRIKTRHQWSGSSVYNPTHGMEVAWERAGDDFDIALGGHTHIATLCREFIRENKRRLALLLGTYKILGDPFARQMGRANCAHNGSGAIIFWPDGRMLWVQELETAKDFLTWARA